MARPGFVNSARPHLEKHRDFLVNRHAIHSLFTTRLRIDGYDWATRSRSSRSDIYMARKTALVVAFFLVGLACLTIEITRQGRTVAASSVTASSVLSNPDYGSDRPSAADDPCAACSAFDAGYNWAEENAIANEEICDREGKRSHSTSFAEGCKQYIHAMTPED